MIDSDAGEIVIRLVYDGPPEAGKTTSLRALAGSLTRPSQSPAEDDRGRTLWFDWMEYIGGRFEGCQIRCQIVSVAGQRELAARRRRVIAGADVVVFVADSAAGELPTTMAYLGELREMLAEVQPPVGVILQANKRDLPDAVPLAQLRTAIAELGWPVGLVESTAAAGTGIRETFVYAVRLALDRVREQLAGGPITDIPAGTAGTADQLLAALRADEAEQTAQAEADLFAGAEIRPEDIDGLDFLPVEEVDAHSLAAELFRDVIAAEPAAPVAPVPAPRPASLTSAAPRPPTPSVPSGAIWPPVEGRAILQELSAVDLSPRRLSTGDWVAGLGTGWRVMSGRDAIYDSLDDGRAALIQWARLHST
ncbi:MAG TPA: GTPase domain-containing protein, partial [Kofleriaceae bacterium]